MRIALIAIAYPPDRSSVAVQMRDLAAELTAQGHEAIMLVPDTTINGSWSLERLDGVQVLRLRALPSRDRNYVWRTIAELVMPWAMLRGLKKSPLRSQRWDAVVWYSPSIFFAPLVRSLKRTSNCRSYLILRDIFPEWMVDLGLLKRGLAYRFLKRIERQQHEAADIIGIQAPSNQKYVSHLEPRPGVTLEVLWNWLAPARDAGCSVDLSTTVLAGRTIFAYAGNMGVAQDMDIFIDLAARLQRRSDIGFLFVGRGSEAARLRATAASRGLTNTLFRDEIDPLEIPGLLAQCHVGLLALDPRHKTHNIPGKFLTYLQAGLPVLARVNPNNDLVRLIEGERVGRVDLDFSLESLERHAEFLADNPSERESMGVRGRALAERLFSPAVAARQIVSALANHG